MQDYKKDDRFLFPVKKTLNPLDKDYDGCDCGHDHCIDRLLLEV